MPFVEAQIVIDAPPRDVYALAKEQERFPEFMPDVETVVVLERHADRIITRWKTLVEDAPIEWIEEDRFDDATPRIDYALLEGDLDTFQGAWTFVERDAGRADRTDAREEGPRKRRDDARRPQDGSRIEGARRALARSAQRGDQSRPSGAKATRAASARAFVQNFVPSHASDRASKSKRANSTLTGSAPRASSRSSR